MTTLSRSPLGRTLGVVAARSSGTFVFATTGAGFNFAISGIPFRVAVSDKRPYERATADYRKDQFDASSSVGDQSLTGWWLRSQLSFHKGAGIRYYEPLDGEEVADRFKDSEAVDPRTPGVVTLTDETTSYSSTYVTHLADAPTVRAEPLAAVTSASAAVLINGGTTTALTPATAGNVAGVASDAKDTYFATAGGIEKVPNAGTTMTSLWTGAVGDGVWWAKGRLFLVATNGDWYAAPKAGGALGATEKFWSSGLSGGWSLADTPGAVMLAQGNTIYSAAVDADGSVPVLTGAVVAAQLPNDETINSLTYSLGYLIISTSRGVRAAIIQGTEVVIGPPLVDGNAAQGASQGTTVFVGVDQSARTGVVALNLSQTVTDLEPAWNYEHDVAGTAAPVVHVSSDSVRYAGGTTGIVATTANRAATGSLTTGFIRYGTLEPKKFHTVKVWTGADNNPGGTVTVSRVAKDGTETTLYTFEASAATSEDIGLGLDDPQDFIGLKFTLTRDAGDATKTPELLGYQLRSLPAPLRQRLIRVPLQVFDVERSKPSRATGREGSAYARLMQLEAAEDAGGLHTYQDFRTGESGTAYIERVEFENTTAPGERDNGFGGVVFLTLRKVT